MTQRHRATAIFIILALAMAGGFAMWHRASLPQKKPTASVAAAPSQLPTPLITAKDPRAGHLGALMSTDPAVANGVLFLVTAAQTGKCHPAQAHDLPQMAVVAGLPVLAIGGHEDADGAATRAMISAVIHDIVARAPCLPFDLRIGAYQHHVDPVAYANAFPDTYFDPDLTAVPEEYEGASLKTRAHDPCNRVAYAVLPLDESRPWQCTGMRAGTRKRIRQLCRAGNPDDAARSIRASTDALPPSCQ